MVTLEDIDKRLQDIERKQQELNKGLAGFQTAFAGIQNVFSMLATSLGDVANMDPKKMMNEAETTNQNVAKILRYVASIYTSIEKKKIEIHGVPVSEPDTA
jgi:hypothetical protein